MRISALKDGMKLKLEIVMAEQEERMREGVENHVRAVTKGKPWLLWKKRLEETAFLDMNVCKYGRRCTLDRS